VDEIEFQLNSRRFHLTRQEVIERMREQKPDPIQTWAVAIEGMAYPVKQVLATVTGENRASFISHRARDILLRLDFPVVDVQRTGSQPIASSGTGYGSTATTTTHQGEDRTPRTRLAILGLTIQLLAGRPQVEVADVLATAEALESWALH
jgi:hypothetical protein